jgi:hypothetical protein
VREEPLRHAEARLPWTGWFSAMCPHTADGVSAGRLAADTGPVPYKPSVHTTAGIMVFHRLPKGDCA